MISSMMRQCLYRVSIGLGLHSLSLDPKILASTLSDEVVQDEEEAKASTQSIQIEDSVHAMTPSPDAPEFYEIYDISYYHMYDI